MKRHPNTGPVGPKNTLRRPMLFAVALLLVQGAMAQSPKTNGWESSPGVVGTLVLLSIVLFVAALIITAQVGRLIKQTKEKRMAPVAEPSEEERAKREAASRYRLRGDELGGSATAFDDKAVIAPATSGTDNPMVDEKI